MNMEKEFLEKNKMEADREKIHREEITVDMELYKCMYLRIIKAALQAQEIIDDAMRECEEIFISQNKDFKKESMLIPVVRYMDFRDLR